MNTVNKLMDILPESAEDYEDWHIEEIIKWQRKQLESYNSGTKPKKATAESEAPKVAEVMKALIASAKEKSQPIPSKGFKRRI